MNLRTHPGWYTYVIFRILEGRLITGENYRGVNCYGYLLNTLSYRACTQNIIIRSSIIILSNSNIK